MMMIPETYNKSSILSPLCEDMLTQYGEHSHVLLLLPPSPVRSVPHLLRHNTPFPLQNLKIDAYVSTFLQIAPRSEVARLGLLE